MLELHFRNITPTAASRLSTADKDTETANKGFSHMWPWERAKWGKNENDITEWIPHDSVSEMLGQRSEKLKVTVLVLSHW